MFGIKEWEIVPTPGFWERGGGQQPQPQLHSCSPGTLPQNLSISKHLSPIPLRALWPFMIYPPRTHMAKSGRNLRWQEGGSPKFQTEMNNVKGSESGSLIGTLWPAADRGGRKPRCLQQPWHTHRHLRTEWNLTESRQIKKCRGQCMRCSPLGCLLSSDRMTV